MSSIIQPTHTDEMQVYIMPADQGEQERLDMQHRLIVKLFDSKLSILPISLKEGDRVLECGAGTGIWMLEFAAQLPPTVQIHGIDITSGLFPTSYPDNIRFTVHSVTSLPESWTSSYNFLHQRFLIGGLTKDMWKSATMEMFRVLVKGGWIELLETAVGGMFPCVGPHSTKTWSIIIESATNKGLIQSPDIHIPGLLLEAGFVNVHTECRIAKIGRFGGEDGIYWISDWIRVLETIKMPLLNAGGYDNVHSEEEYDVMVEGTKEEWLRCDAEVAFYTISAQKPT